MQAQFLCLAHSLMVLLESDISDKHDVINHKEISRCEKRDKPDTVPTKKI
jgi:hypothetical protein